MCQAGSGDLSFAKTTFLTLHFIPAHTELAGLSSPAMARRSMIFRGL